MIKDPGGRPATTEEQFKLWLEDMRPHLVLGCSLWRAIDKAGLESHTTVIYEKYRLGDWFAQKVDKWRSTPGENGNEAMVILVNKIKEKALQGQSLTNEEVKILTFFNERHRTAQPFFVNRTETAESKREDLGKILDILESDYDEFSEPEQEGVTTQDDATTQEQEVANDTPLQD
jgi:hypothetical protein